MATKPTINEYDRVYGGLRPNSNVDYVLLRTWILSLAEGGGIVSITYADLAAAVLAGTLVPGQLYEISDFRSRQTIPNTVDVQLGVVEALFVQALTVDTLSTWAYSADNPTDIIQYDINNTDYGADMGRITYRKDTQFNLEAWFDFRNFVFRRWETAPASGVFTVITDNGNASQDTGAFGAQCVNCSIGIYIDAGVVTQNNIVIGQRCEDVFFEANNRNHTLVFRNTEITFGADGNLCIIGSDTDVVTLGQFCVSNTIGQVGNGITLGNNVSNSIIGDEANGITLLDRCALIIVGNQCQNILFENGVSSSSCADSMYNIKFSPGVVNRTTNNANSNSNENHQPNWIEGYIEWDFAVDGSAQGTYNLSSLPPGSSIVGVSYQGDTLAGSLGSTLAVGIETDDPTGIIATTPFVDVSFGGDIQSSGLVPSPDAPITVQRNLILTIGTADMTSGVFRLWFQSVVNAN